MTLINHAIFVAKSPEFNASDSPLWAANRLPHPDHSASEVAECIVDLQLHNII